MIQIGFCDDDPSVLDELHELLGSYRAEHNADIAPTAFQSPFELLASIEKGARFDILLLDVLMPGENGIECEGLVRMFLRFRFCGIVCCVLYRFPFPQSDL